MIHDWIAKDSPVNAVSFVGRLVDRINQLADQDYPGVIRDDLLPGIRRVNVGDYAILLRLPDDKTIQVVQVIHGSRDIPQHIRAAKDILQ